VGLESERVGPSKKRIKRSIIIEGRLSPPSLKGKVKKGQSGNSPTVAFEVGEERFTSQSNSAGDEAEQGFSKKGKSMTTVKKSRKAQTRNRERKNVRGNSEYHRFRQEGKNTLVAKEKKGIRHDQKMKGSSLPAGEKGKGRNLALTHLICPSKKTQSEKKKKHHCRRKKNHRHV